MRTEACLKKQKMKRHKRRMRALFVAELICIFSMLSFLAGKRSGAANFSTKGFVETQDILSAGGNGDAPVLSAVEPEGEKPQTEEILLVNKDHKLPEDYNVKLMTLPDGVHKAAMEAYQPLCDMLNAGQKEGLVFEVCSSYRDVKRQKELFDEDVNALIRRGYSYEDAYDEVARETMPPGYSEHSTGLAFDIVSRDYQMLDAGQKKTAENKWLREHCAEYGFILRYPEGAEDITKISYESWHFRYVGEEAAQYIMENGITLEEYLGV